MEKSQPGLVYSWKVSVASQWQEATRVALCSCVSRSLSFCRFTIFSSQFCYVAPALELPLDYSGGVWANEATGWSLLTFCVESNLLQYKKSSGGGYKQKVRMFVHEVAEIMVVCLRG